MPRFRCLFPPNRSQANTIARSTGATSIAEATRIALNDLRGVELAYEFDAPDIITLQNWLASRGISPTSVTPVDAA